MKTIYTAVYKCKLIEPVGVPGYNNITLGLPMVVNGDSDIIVKGTCSAFQVGKDYLIGIAEKE